MINFVKYRIQDKSGNYDETLTCFDRSTLSNSEEMNKTNQIDFTAINDGSIGYQLLQNENYILFNGQKYRIKQAEKDDEAYDNKRVVSATHIWFDCQYVYQYDTIPGKKKLAAKDLMKFVFDENELGNYGFTWDVQGSNELATFVDYGNKSGLECVNDCIEKFNLVVVPNNKHITLMAMAMWQHKVNKSFRYIHDTPTFTANIDTTEIQNIAKVYGKTNAPVTSPIGTATGTINTMENDGAPVVDDPDKPTHTVQQLPNGTKWIMDSKVVANGETWYRVSTNGWVNEKYITFDKNGDRPPENHIITDVTGQGTIKTSNDSGKEDTSNGSLLPIGNAAGTINTMATGGAPVFSEPGNESSVVSHLDNGTSWKSNVKKVVDNVTYYQVGTNQWVSDKYFTFDKDGDVKPEEHNIQTVLGQGTVKASEKDTSSSGSDDDSSSDSDSGKDKKKDDTTVYIYDSPWTPQHEVGRKLADGGQYKISGEITDGANGKTWYRVATNEWICADNVSFEGDSDVSPTEVKKDDGDTVDDHSTDYFPPFIVRDEKSIQEWGERPGPAIVNEDIDDPEEMRKYALAQMKTEPTLDISLTYTGSDSFKIGDMVYCDIQPESFTSWVTVVSTKNNPLSYDNTYEVSLNSTPQTLVDYEMSIESSFANVRYNAAISTSNGTITNSFITRKVGMV